MGQLRSFAALRMTEPLSSGEAMVLRNSTRRVSEMPQGMQLNLKDQQTAIPKCMNINKLHRSVTSVFGTGFAVTNGEETVRK